MDFITTVSMSAAIIFCPWRIFGHSSRLWNSRTSRRTFKAGFVFLKRPELTRQQSPLSFQQRLKVSLGFQPRVISFSHADLETAIRNNPYPEDKDNPKSVHFYFLSEVVVDADLDAMCQLTKPSEDFTLTERVFYLLAPEGIGRSKLAQKAEQNVGVPMTARNHNSVLKIAQLAG
jgi:uncharacterized protein (DUF1697 family)